MEQPKTWYTDAHAVKLLPNDDPLNPKFFTLAISPVSFWKADDTFKQVQLFDTFGLDSDKHASSESQTVLQMKNGY